MYVFNDSKGQCKGNDFALLHREPCLGRCSGLALRVQVESSVRACGVCGRHYKTRCYLPS